MCVDRGRIPATLRSPVPTFRGLITRRALAAAVAVLALPIALLAVLHSPRARLEEAVATLPHAQQLPLWLGCGLFVVSLLCSAGAWRTALGACGGTVGPARAAAWYGSGSLANSLLPARVGDAIRVGLFSQAAPQEGRVWTAGGIFLAMGLVRGLVLLVVVAAAAAFGALPLWPIAVLGGVLAAGAVVAFRVRHTQPHSRVSHLLDAFRALGRSPRTASVLGAWAGASIAARVAAAAATASALGIHSPLHAGLVIVPALELTSLMPLTPGNVGITSGGVAVALHATGTGTTQALAIGIALHAVELTAGVGFGAASVLFLLGGRSPRSRRVVAAAAGVAALGAALLTGALIVS